MSQKPATLKGPVTGGRRGAPFGAYFGDLGGLGYVEEEYFLSGEAQRYRPTGPLTPDGKWLVEPAGTGPFNTRLLVRRPRDPARFNGTVVAEWTNVSAGYEIPFADPPGVYDGAAYVSISAQHVGLHGFAHDPKGLIAWDPERYGSLSILGDSISYDIFTQAGRAVGPDRPRGPLDPLPGFEVKRLIAIGGSQSGIRLLTYANAIQPRERAYDAIMPVVAPGMAAGFDDAILDPAEFAKLPMDEVMRRLGPPARVRDDLATPVMIVNSESETLRYLPVRQPDTARFRFWEVAGASHAPRGQMELIRQKTERDGVYVDPGPDFNPSDVMWLPAVDAAISHVSRWIDGGPPPPSQPPIEVVAGAIVRDARGNAGGGVRLPLMEAPIARYKSETQTGSTERFPSQMLKALYPTHADYVASVKAAAEAARRGGVILQSAAEDFVRTAEAAPVPG